MAARLYTTLLLLPLTTQALERLDDGDMAAVTGQQGVSIISDYGFEIDSISLTDSDDGGVASMTDIVFGTRVNRKQRVDFEISDERTLYDERYGAGAYDLANGGPAANSRQVLAFFNRDLPYDVTVGALEINNRAVASFGITDFEVNAFSHLTGFTAGLHPDDLSMNVYAYAGGADGRGITFDVEIPKTAQYEQYVEINGVQFIGTVRHIDADPDDPNLAINNAGDDGYNPAWDTNSDGRHTIDDYEGGLVARGMTLDGVAEGMRIGLPTIENGLVAITDFRIGNEEVGYDYLNDIVLKNISLTGGHLILKPDAIAGQSSINIDGQVNTGTGFTYIYRDPNDQLRADISLTKDLTIADMSINTDDVEGYVIGLGEVRGQVFVDNMTMAPNFLTDAERSRVAPLGELTVNLNIANTSYLHITGN